jgi:hypothetical protein
MLALHPTTMGLLNIEAELREVLAARGKVRRAGWFN